MLSNIIEIIILSIVQGISEFLPISSSAHLNIVEIIFEFNSNSLMIDVSLHLGSLLAIIFYFRNELLDLRNNQKLLSLLIIGSIPIVIAGYIISSMGLVSLLENNLKIIAWTTLIFGIILYLADKSKFDKNNLPTENYKRFAKTLMTDGNKDFFIQKPKLDFEIIALNSPYNLNNNLFEFQLFEKGNPLENWQITIFSRDKENSYKEIVKTNRNGIGIIKVIKSRTYLLSSVKLEKANYIEKLKYKSDWFSFWASLTFKN